MSGRCWDVHMENLADGAPSFLATAISVYLVYTDATQYNTSGDVGKQWCVAPGLWDSLQPPRHLISPTVLPRPILLDIFYSLIPYNSIRKKEAEISQVLSNGHSP